MKKIISIAIGISLLSCNNKDQSGLEVKGTIKNSPAKFVYLEEDVAGSPQPVIVDSTTVGKDGSFKLSGKTKEETMLLLRTDQSQFPFALVINDTKDITVNADLANKAEPYTVNGSPASQALIDLDKNLDQQAQSIYEMGKVMDSLSKVRQKDTANKALDSTLNIRFGELDAAAQQLKNNAKNTIEQSTSPVLSLYALGAYQRMAQNLGLQGFSNSETGDIINKAATKFPNSTALAEAKKKYQPRKAADFTLPDVNGKPVSLSSFKGKYVLVDFWASWCGPCRQENPNVVAAYKRFKDKNFTILGVSLDQTKDAWLKAINDDGITWTQVSDLKFWNNAAASLYNVNSIPYNFLVDPNGNIIAEELRGPELMNTLNRVLK